MNHHYLFFFITPFHTSCLVSLSQDRGKLEAFSRQALCNNSGPLTIIWGTSTIKHCSLLQFFCYKTQYIKLGYKWSVGLAWLFRHYSRIKYSKTQISYQYNFQSLDRIPACLLTGESSFNLCISNYMALFTVLSCPKHKTITSAPSTGFYKE